MIALVLLVVVCGVANLATILYLWQLIDEGENKWSSP